MLAFSLWAAGFAGALLVAFEKPRPKEERLLIVLCCAAWPLAVIVTLGLSVIFLLANREAPKKWSMK